MSLLTQTGEAQKQPPRTTWHKREGYRIANECISLTVLMQGGTLAEFGFADAQGVVAENALWEAPWLAEDELPRDDAAIERAYGELSVGRFLNRYTGHALCLDGFGPATAEEVRTGAALHGEATLADWELLCDSSSNAMAKAHLPLAQLTVERHFLLHPGETVVRIAERVTNLGPSTRALHWVQHATIGSPMFDESSMVSASVARGITWPFIYEGVPLLATDAPFFWPNALMVNGGDFDLRRLFATPHAGFVAAARQPEKRKFGFVAALHPTKHTALIYVFPANLFPWVAFWEENRCRQEWPWSGRAQARGLEFGTTPLPLGNSQVDAAGPLLETPTSFPLRAGGSVHAPWIMAIAQTPPGWSSIDDVTVELDALHIHSEGRTVAIDAHGIEAFLASAGESA